MIEVRIWSRSGNLLADALWNRLTGHLDIINEEMWPDLSKNIGQNVTLRWGEGSEFSGILNFDDFKEKWSLIPA